ncbi:sensor histidine kinase [Azospirillum palustre]
MPLNWMPQAGRKHPPRLNRFFSGAFARIGAAFSESLMARTVGMICLPLLLAVGLAVAVAISFSSRDAQTALEARARQTVALLAGGVGDALWNVDRVAAQAILRPLSEDPDFVGALIIESGGSVFLRLGDAGPSRSGLIVEQVSLIRPAAGGQAGGQRIGQLQLYLTTARAAQIINSRAWAIALSGLGLLAAVCSLLAVIVRGVTLPIRQMTDGMAVLAAGRVDLEIPRVDRRDEVGRMAAALGTLKQHAAERLEFIEHQARHMELIEEIVTRRTEELSAALETLKRAQDELIRSEKLAALGGMVAAIAHEINTPIGNGLTVATTLSEKITEFQAILEGKELRRSVIRDYSGSFGTASQLLVGNLLRASELIGRFKRVAVDQTGELRRRFELDVVCGEVVAMLRPTYRHSSVSLDLKLPAGVVLDSFPGALGQVLTNLITNAMIHAFADATVPGTIAIAAVLEEDGRHVTLTVADDGAGIAAAVLPRIFDPFFTTKLGSGGSGLGLHIVYAIVMRVLGGVVAVESRIGQGTRFSMVLPLVAPRQSGHDAAEEAVAMPS